MRDNKIKAALESGDTARIDEALRSCLVHHNYLDLKARGLEDLPAQLGDLHDRVVFLDLRKNAFKEVPEVVRTLNSTQVLYLNNNKLSDLPAWMGELSQVIRLEVGGNKMKGLPEAIFSMPSLLTVRGVKGYARGEAHRGLEIFLQKTQAMAPETRRALFPVYEGEGGAGVALSALFAGLSGSFPELERACTTAIMARTRGKAVDKDAVITVLGTVTFKKTALKKSLSDKGIGYATSVKASTTHIVLGRSARNLDGLDGRDFTFLTQDKAAKMIAAEASSAPEGSFLADAGPTAASHIDNINTLLFSGDDASAELGFELIKSGGMAPELVTGLFVVARLSGDAKVRGKARQFLKTHGSAGVQKVLTDRSKLDPIGDKAERNTATALKDYARRCKEIDWVKVGRFIRGKSGYGLSFVLDTAPLPVKLEVLREHIVDGALNFHALISPRYRPDYENPYSYYTGVKVPSYLYELTELSALDLSWCCFTSLPSGLSRLGNLKALDLTGNMLTKLPKEIAAMTSLRALNIGLNAFADFPPQIEAMPWLERVDVQGNRRGRDSHLYTPLSAPDHVRAKLSGCTFVEGLSSDQARRDSYYR